MLRWRIVLTLLLITTVALPLAWPLFSLTALDPDSLARTGSLARNTALLVAGTLVFALPAGVLLAILLERTDLPGRQFLSTLLILPLFIPLPLVTSGWQTILGAGGLVPLLALPSGEWTPWSQGIGSAVWLHALVGVPWVVLIVMQGLRAVEPELEEDALTIRSAGWVLWHVSLSRCAPSLGAAALWLGFQTAGEITITDLMQVRTFAEEVYTQLVGPEVDPAGGDPLGRAVMASLFSVLLAVGAVLYLARRADRLVPPGQVGFRPTVVLALGRWRLPLLLVTTLALLGLLAIPSAGLFYRAGLAGLPESWSAGNLLGQVRRTAAIDAGLIVRSLLVASSSGFLCTGVALVACWLARDSRSFRLFLLVLLAVAWSLPGPVVGLGLKDLFRLLVDVSEPFTPVPSALLWHGPSWLPLVVVGFLRFLPFATAIVWPAVRGLPLELLEAARLDGATPGMELRLVVWPLTRSACLKAALAVSILSLGELSAGKLVSTPGAASYAEVVWTQMHYGVSPDLAARCLLLMAVVVVLTGSTVVGGSVRWRGVSRQDGQSGLIDPSAR